MLPMSWLAASHRAALRKQGGAVREEWVLLHHADHHVIEAKGASNFLNPDRVNYSETMTEEKKR